jgi:hypothetical protein
MGARGRPSKLSDEDWDLLIDYYNAPHTMEECGVVFGITATTISRAFKKWGIKARPRLVPATPEAKARRDAVIYQTKEERESLESEPAPPGPPPKRRIIKFSGDESSLYERESNGRERQENLQSAPKGPS